MHFQFISLFPEMIAESLGCGVVSQAIHAKKISYGITNPRQFATGVHKSVDDRPYGGGDGMVMLPDILDESTKAAEQAILKAQRENQQPTKKIYLSARGRVFNDSYARELVKHNSLILLCGRYGGVDERLLAQHDYEELCIGDYVLSGGELAALVVTDAIARFIPGVLGNSQSTEEESFAKGLLEQPQFTRPSEWNGMQVPKTLMSGNHAEIEKWRQALAILITTQNRFDLLLKTAGDGTTYSEKNSINRKVLTQAQSLLGQLDENDLKVCRIVDRKMISDRLIQLLAIVSQ